VGYQEPIERRGVDRFGKDAEVIAPILSFRDSVSPRVLEQSRVGRTTPEAA
jgi:hypothetical protein